MSVETHYICEVCNNVAIRRTKTEDSDDIGKWFTLTVSANMMSSMSTEKRTYQIGQVCSVKCMEEYFETVKKLVLTNAKGSA